LKLLVFDEGFAASIGFPIRALDILLTSLLVIAIVLGLQAVGAVLMSAMLVAPAVAARQWTDKLNRMVLLAASFGALAGVSGTIISSSASRIPTGPTIVLCATVIVGFSIAFAANRGLVWHGAAATKQAESEGGNGQLVEATTPGWRSAIKMHKVLTN